MLKGFDASVIYVGIKPAVLGKIGQPQDIRFHRRLPRGAKGGGHFGAEIPRRQKPRAVL